jgi:uncharacterized protein DUF3108
MRLLVLCTLLAACEQRFVAPAVPELVAPSAPTGPLDVPALVLVPNERLIWDVQLKGMTVGRAELVVGDDDTVRSEFHTTGLARTVAVVSHVLETEFDRVAARPLHATEHLVDGGDETDLETTFEPTRVHAGERVLALPPGKVGHTLHTALGVLRAWARPGARPGYVYVVHAGELYELAVHEPVVEMLHGVHVLRVDGAIASEKLTIQLWITDDDRRVPLRIEVTSDDVHAVAELAG